MERDFEEGDKHEKRKLTVVDPDWLDLREITNLILDRLEVDDYIRFSAVCKNWQSIQNEHRIRYSSYPPPSPLPLSFPWLKCFLCSYFGKVEGVNIVFHVPDKQKTYNIPLPKPYTKHLAFNSRYGWKILLLDQSLCIANPVTGVQIELPPLPTLFPSCHVLPISHPPSDPDCTVIIKDHSGKAYLNRLNSNNSWKTIQSRRLCLNDTIFYDNKIYCMTNYKRVWMIDTLLSDLVEHMIEMDCSEISTCQYNWCWFVDYFGELVMSNFILGKPTSTRFNIKEVEVCKADFSRNKWVRMESLGEYALFLSWHSRFAIPAVDVGCKKNTIYYTGDVLGDHQWRAFDLSTKNWIDGPAISPLCSYNGSYYWFLPSLDYFGVDKKNGTRRIQSR